jgi:SHS2 domain-containing protein
MATVELFDHTADVGLRIHAETLDEVFRAAAGAMFDYVVVNRRDVLAADRSQIALDAETTDDLLVSWLNELIFRSETEHKLYTLFEVHVAADGLSLVAEIAGEPIDEARHILDHEVKAATHHGQSVKQVEGGWMAEVILDI